MEKGLKLIPTTLRKLALLCEQYALNYTVTCTYHVLYIHTHFYSCPSSLNQILIERGVELGMSNLFFERHTDIKGPPCVFITFCLGLTPIPTEREYGPYHTQILLVSA